MGSSRNKTVANVLIAVVMSITWTLFSTTFTLGDGDFPAFYLGATLARQGEFHNLHNERLQVQVQHTLIPQRSQPPVYFTRPQIYALLLAPLALLPIRASFVAWIVAQAAMLLCCWCWAYRRFGSDAVALASLFPPAIMGIAFGQDPVVFLAIAVLSFFLFERERPLASGFVFGLGCIKPHLMLLMPLALGVQKRWRMMGGFVLAGLIEAAVSILLGGWASVAGYVRFLAQEQQHLSPTPWRMMNVYAIALNFGIHNSAVNCALVLLVVACVAGTCWHGEWWRALSAAMIGGFLVAPHAYLYDSTMLILPALLIVFQARAWSVRLAAAAVLTPIPSLLQLADMPWTGVAAILLLVLLVALTWEALRQHIAAPLPQALNSTESA